ncbi:hypothetical protein GH714_014078 [Hevea brasiliensis]|uniref:Pectin acetylesterase n=1 Tax=Hevea brasiliensis TaxID=3981 RepID=A0A6A6LSU6_HEVBR|nr:hypothetical protein GH714_014078 [Hevea brasiliensis]
MANPKLRSLLWWRKWAKKDWAIAAVGFTIFISALAFLFDSRTNDLDISTAEDLVDLTLLQNAKDRGAFCLDGSSPGYHFQEGFGSGSRNWLLHIEISSTGTKSIYVTVMVHLLLAILKNVTNLYFSGQLIWESVMDELLSIGLSNANQALLSGCSAGGLATLIHCDNFRDLMPKDATVKCLADAGFFLDEVFLKVCPRTVLQEWTHPRQCLFPQEIIKGIRTPLFLVNPAYDYWQTIAEAVGDWYFNRRVVNEVDCPYPCNPTCYNMEFA